MTATATAATVTAPFPSTRFMSFRDVRMMVCDWAEEACRVAGVTDPAVTAAVETSRAYANGTATAAEMKKAKCAAWEVARTAAAYAAAYAAGGGDDRPPSVASVSVYAAAAAAYATGTEDCDARNEADAKQRQDVERFTSMRP